MLAVAHARLAARGAWALNEKGLIFQSGLEDAAEILTAVGWTPPRLQESASKVRQLLRLERQTDPRFDRAVRAAARDETAADETGHEL